MSTSTAHYADLDAAGDQWWKRTGGDHPLGAARDFQALYDSNPKRRTATTRIPGGPTFLLCIDDRLLPVASLPPGANFVHMAGEGILNPNALEDLSGVITCIITHRNCGAKALYSEQHPGQGDDHDAVGIQAVVTLAAQLNVPITQTVDAAELAPIHFARAIYFDGTGRFNWARAGLPPGFMVSRKYISRPAYAQSEVVIAAGIAMGGHGLGRRFTAATPLYAVAVADRHAGLLDVATLVGELRQAVGGHDAVRIDSIVVRDEAYTGEAYTGEAYTWSTGTAYTWSHETRA